jgi:single-strand DNA-binding protein
MIGNLTKDIEFKYLPTNSALSKGSIATTYKYKQGDGTQKEEVCFLDFTIFGKLAEIANQYLRKGSKVMLEGRLVLDEWTGTDGQKRTKHSLRVEEMKMLGSKNDAPAKENEPSYSSNQPTYNQPPKKEVPNLDDLDDEYPF